MVYEMEVLAEEHQELQSTFSRTRRAEAILFGGYAVRVVWKPRKGKPEDTNRQPRGKNPEEKGFARVAEPHKLLDAIAAHRVANRPNRFEPRMKKRRRMPYDLLMTPRAEAKLDILKSISNN